MHWRIPIRAVCIAGAAGAIADPVLAEAAEAVSTAANTGGTAAAAAIAAAIVGTV